MVARTDDDALVALLSKFSLPLDLIHPADRKQETEIERIHRHDEDGDNVLHLSEDLDTAMLRQHSEHVLEAARLLRQWLSSTDNDSSEGHRHLEHGVRRRIVAALVPNVYGYWIDSVTRAECRSIVIDVCTDSSTPSVGTWIATNATELLGAVQAHDWKNTVTAKYAVLGLLTLLEEKGPVQDKAIGYQFSTLDAIDAFLPLLLQFCDHFESHVRAIGCIMMEHCTLHVPSAHLQRRGLLQLFQSTLAPLQHESNPYVVLRVWPCVAALMSRTPVESRPKAMDEAVGILLSKMQFESRINRKRAYAASLRTFVQVLRHQLIAHLKQLDAILEEYIESFDYEVVLITVKVMAAIIVYGACRIHGKRRLFYHELIDKAVKEPANSLQDPQVGAEDRDQLYRWAESCRQCLSFVASTELLQSTEDDQPDETS